MAKDIADRRAPRWLRVANRLNIAMLRCGIGTSTQRILTVVGRASGIPRSTPVAVVTIDHAEYLVAGYEGADWVKNARAAGRGELTRGTVVREIRIDEVPSYESVPVLREFLRTVRGGRSFLTVSTRATDTGLAEAATHHPVFRIR
jgi:deazaflavin-dependent oxidoreductase (nitroreductase family)